MDLGMEDDLNRFYEYVNNETTSCADRKKALNDFKEKVRVATVAKAREITGVQ